MKRILLFCLAISVSGCAERRSTETWVAQTQHKDASLRLEAVRALAERRSEADVVIPILMKALRDSNPAVRRAAAQAVGSMGEEARSAVPGLLPLLEDQNTGVRKVAALAIKRIDPARRR